MMGLPYRGDVVAKEIVRRRTRYNEAPVNRIRELRGRYERASWVAGVSGHGSRRPGMKLGKGAV
jgi:hypothetical protein